MYHEFLVPTEAREGVRGLRLELEVLLAAMWMLGTTPGPLEEQPSALNP